MLEQGRQAGFGFSYRAREPVLVVLRTNGVLGVPAQASVAGTAQCRGRWLARPPGYAPRSGFFSSSLFFFLFFFAMNSGPYVHP